jgi:predicted Fe-Mo cluster-binding NifX family protein
MEKKIAISVQGGDSLEAVLDPRFGRAARFLIVDEGGNILEVIDNGNVNASHGAGPATASLVSRTGATMVISGRYGPKAYDALKAFGVEPWVGQPDRTVGDLLEDLKQSRLQRA